MRALVGIFIALVVFSLNIVEALIKWALRPRPGKTRTGMPTLSPQERVLELERIRQARGYKPGWLYFRCRELGLEETLLDLQANGRI